MYVWFSLGSPTLDNVVDTLSLLYEFASGFVKYDIDMWAFVLAIEKMSLF